MAEQTTIRLPEAFQEKMKKLLGEEYEAFVQSYEQERVQGLRFNTEKVSLEQALGQVSEQFHLEKIPWAKEGYYYDGQTRPGKHPYHDAGVYYIQEPSAMAVVELLDPQPGERILDLCAAPGGKTTHIAERLQGKGLLVSNEIHPARARILSQNVERMGIPNAVVTNEDSGKLTRYFPEFFDRIVVDAPCSGEGMFRKEEGAADQWSPDHVVLCEMRQAEILDNAASMLKCGGRLVYSTCTFSPEENEGSIQTFLERHPEFSVEEITENESEKYAGFDCGHPEWIENGREELKHTFRIWPHRTEGEGHYMAVLRKSGELQEQELPPVKKGKCQEDALHFYQSTLKGCEKGLPEWLENQVLFGDQVYAVPKEMVDYKGLKVLRPGLHLGTIKKKRFEPSHALALYLHPSQVLRHYDCSAGGEEILRYLKGETLPTDAHSTDAPQSSGWVLMTVDGYSIGWAKLVGTTLKNHYPKGLRRV